MNELKNILFTGQRKTKLSEYKHSVKPRLEIRKHYDHAFPRAINKKSYSLLNSELGHIVEYINSNDDVDDEDNMIIIIVVISLWKYLFINKTILTF